MIGTADFCASDKGIFFVGPENSMGFFLFFLGVSLGWCFSLVFNVDSLFVNALFSFVSSK